MLILILIYVILSFPEIHIFRNSLYVTNSSRVPHTIACGYLWRLSPVYIYDLLKSYCSNDSSSEETENTSIEESLDNSEVCSVYLVAYSQADIVKFASREDFAQSIVWAGFLNELNYHINRCQK